jgi:thiol-disulfide isomerase/thioredoxin
MDPRTPKFALALVAVIAGAAGLYLASRQSAPPTPVATTADAPAVPTHRPSFSLVDLDGKQRSSDEYAGKAVLFNFWATWCAPCRREIPMLNALQAEYGPRGLQVLGIAMDTPENIALYRKELNIEYPSLQGELEAVAVGRQFGLDLYALPISVFTDKEGRILGVHMGELTREQAEPYLAKML